MVFKQQIVHDPVKHALIVASTYFHFCFHWREMVLLDTLLYEQACRIQLWNQFLDQHDNMHTLFKRGVY